MRNSYLFQSLAALLLATCLSACGATELVLTVDRESINAGGTDFATITAKGFTRGEPVEAGIKISFTTTSGSFNPTTDQTDIDASTNALGMAQVKLYSAKSQGQATVTASFYDKQDNYSETSITIKFEPPRPVDGTFRLSCDAVNIGALRKPIPDIKVTCNLNAQTRGGSSIPAAALNPTFLLEAGSITAQTDSYTSKRVFIYTPKGGSSTPSDVDPRKALDEPSFSDKNGKTRNPRDGLVTLVAVADGEEAFNDTNGNGKYDQGEPFSDAAEPFLDKDDDDTHDPNEKYVDANGNGQWDKANGVWDSKVKIMAIYKMLWTGPVLSYKKASRVELSAATTKIADGGKLDLTAYVLDANMNPVAAFQKNSDYLEWTLSTVGCATSNSDATPAMKNALGFSFDTSSLTERKRWKIVPKSFKPPTYTFTVEDGDPLDVTKAFESYTVTIKAYITPGPTGEGYYLSQITEAITPKVEGSCD